MLVSHPYKFIYIKTIKTASTSVEGLLEPLCSPPGHVVTHATPERVTAYGIVGRRGVADPDCDVTYYNHMSAREIRALLPVEFATYTKIANVRDPYAKCISRFHMLTRLKPLEANALAIHAPYELRARFEIFLRERVPKDDRLLLIGHEMIVDRIIRFEQLLSDLAELNCELNLGLGNVAENLPNFKRTDRALVGPRAEAYLSPSAIRIINEHFDWYFRRFQYQRREPDAIEV